MNVEKYFKVYQNEIDRTAKPWLTADSTVWNTSENIGYMIDGYDEAVKRAKHTVQVVMALEGISAEDMAHATRCSLSSCKAVVRRVKHFSDKTRQEFLDLLK